MDLSIDHEAKTTHLTLHIILDQITEITVTPVTTVRTTDKASTGYNNRNRGYQHNPRYKQRNQNYQNRYNNQDRNRFDNRRGPNKYQHHRNQHKAQIIFKFSDQNMIEMMQMVRGFINLIKANPTTRDQYKSNKLAVCKEYDNEVNESEIHSSNLDQVQQLINEDTDLVFDALVAADYIDEIDCENGICQQQA